MSERGRVVGPAILLALLNACAASGGTDIVVAGDEGCSYSGPATVDAGSVTVALHLTSLGHNELSVAKLEDGHSYTDLVEYLDASSDPITDRPPWVTEVITLELEHTGGEREGVSEDVNLGAGEYALICLDHQGFAGTGPTAVVLGSVSAEAP